MSLVSKMNLRDLNYHIVPTGRLGSCSYADIHDKVFDFWVQQWTKAFEATGEPKSGWEDHFMRQDLVTAITHKDQIVGCHLYTFYDLTAHSIQGSEYFAYIKKETINKLLDTGFRYAMTMEYICVDPKYNRNSLEIGIGKAITALGALVAESKGADCLLGMPISSCKADKMMENVGSYTVQDGIEKYGYKLKLMVAPTQPAERGKDLNLKKITNELWARRIDYSTRMPSISVAA